MKTWMKGAILGFIWSLLIFLNNIYKFVVFYEELSWINYLIALPLYIARELGFGFVLGFIGVPLVGIVLGALLGFLYEWYKGRSLNIEGKIGAWRWEK